MARTKRPFDPSDHDAAKRLLVAKFADSDLQLLEGMSHDFVKRERDPYRRYLNDSRVVKLDVALESLIVAIDALPPDLQARGPPQPTLSELSAEVRDAVMEPARAAALTELAFQAFKVGKNVEGAVAAEAQRRLANERLAKTSRTFELIPLGQFRHLLGFWRAALRVHNNEPDANDRESILAAKGVRVRFAARVGLHWVMNVEDSWWPEVSGRDLALLAIVSGLEVHKPTTDSEALFDAWKHARRRAFDILKETEGFADEDSNRRSPRRRRAARPPR